MIICDYLTVSTPRDNGPALAAACSDVCLQLDGSQTEGLGVRINKHGLLRYGEKNQVATLSASGVMLAQLRAANMLFDFLAAIASHGPYKVTHVDVARDEECDAPSQLAWLYGRLRVAGAQLTRKKIRPDEINCMFSRGPDGRDTGSIMIGDRRSAETTAIVYDRQHDARRKGKPDPGSLLRTEIRTGIAGLSLKDVAVPDPLFWHFATPTFGKRPDDVCDWQPWGEGFCLDKPDADPLAQLRRQVERSSDLNRMLELADQLDGDGIGQLQRLISQRIRLHLETLKFTAGRSANAPTGEQLRGKLNG